MRNLRLILTLVASLKYIFADETGEWGFRSLLFKSFYGEEKGHPGVQLR